MKENSQRVKNIKVAQTIDLVTGLLLLLLVQGPEGNTGDLDDLETDTRNITNGVTGTTETGNEDLVVLIDEVEATVTGDEGRDLLAVLNPVDSITKTKNHMHS